MLVPTAGALEEWINDMCSDTTGLGSCSVGLYQNQVTPGPGTVLGELVEANYDGYTRKASHTFGSVFVDSNGLYTKQAQTLVFQPNGDDTMNTIYGLFVTGDDSTGLFAVEPFDAPKALTGPLTAISVTLRVGLTPGASYGFSVVAD